MDDESKTWNDALRDADFERHIVVRRRKTSSPRLVHPHSLHVEGTRAREDGALEESGQLLQRALCLAPDNSSCLTSYGKTLVEAGRLEDALACFQRAVAADPRDTRPRHELGRVLCRLGRYVEAVSCYQGILRVHPADFSARQGLGRGYRGTGRLEDAAHALRVATKQSPGEAEPWVELARTWNEMGRFRKAKSACQKATRIAPRLPSVWRVMGWTCLAMDSLDEAADAFRTADKLSPDDEEARAGLAAIRLRDGDLDGAEALLSPLIDAGCREPRVATAYADLCVRQGRASEAVELLREVVAQPLGASDRVRIAFGLGEVLEETNQPEEAMRAWRHANALLNPEFDAANHTRRVDEVRKIWTRDLIRSLPRSGISGRELVFVVGMPRSGINLFETVLSAHPMVYPSGRNQDLAQWVSRLPLQIGVPWPHCMERFRKVRVEPVAQKLLGNWNRASGHARRICISDPLNFRYLGLIGFLFPEARVIHMRRDPRDTVLSAFAQPMLGAELGFCGSIENLAHAWRDCSRLMQHWHRILDLPILDVNYEDLVREPGREMAKIGHFLGLRGMHVCETFFEVPPRFGVPAPLEPPRPLDERRIDRWKPFRQWLEPVMGL